MCNEKEGSEIVCVPLPADLERHGAQARWMGGAAKLARQRRDGRPDARARLAGILP
jgi:hypothetical protein